jgi:hypothetical protein
MLNKILIKVNNGRFNFEIECHYLELNDKIKYIKQMGWIYKGYTVKNY